MDESKSTYDLYGKSLAIDYETQGDSWLHKLHECLTEIYENITGWGASFEQASSTFIYPHWTYKPTVDANDVNGIQLNIVPLSEEEKKSVYVFLVANNEVGEQDREKWKAAINKAIDLLNDDNPEFEWAAVIGFDGGNIEQPVALRKKVSFGNVIIRPGRKPLKAEGSYGNQSIYGSQYTMAWPIIIEGKSKGYNWWAASNEAAQEVQDIAALVSLSLETTWKVIHSPQNLPPGALQIPKLADNEPPWNGPEKKLKSIPKWATSALDSISEETELRQILRAYYQGLMMQSEHPSYAYVAFTGVIECIGKKILGKKCPCCGSEYGDKKKYIAGIESVVPNGAERKLLIDGYKLRRSTTAHEGSLHGFEHTGGSMISIDMFAPRHPSVDFVFNDLRKIKDAATKALTLQLRQTIKTNQTV